MKPGLRIQLLGPPHIWLGEQEVALPRRRSRALLFYLAAHSQAVSRQQIIEVLWTDLPRSSALQTLRTTLYGLKQVVGSYLVTSGERLMLTDEVWVDAREFLHLINSAEALSDLRALQSAATLYRGDFLTGFTVEEAQGYEDWIILERERYRRKVVKVFQILAQHFESMGSYSAALENLERALAFNPLQEDLQREVIRLLHLSGDRPAAIQRYAALIKLLDKELGVPPMLETRRLYEDILAERPLPPVRPPAGEGGSIRRTVAVEAAVSTLPETRRVATVEELPFVGRLEELRLLREYPGGGHFYLVEGEPGIGKTRLIRQALQGFRGLALMGGCLELEQPVPYLPVVDAIRSLSQSPGGAQQLQTAYQDLLPVWQAEVSRLLPELGTQAGNLPVTATDEGRIWEGVSNLLRNLAQRFPLVLFLDDLQWADDSTLALLSYLTRKFVSVPVTFLATARPYSHQSALGRFLQNLHRNHLLHRVLLSRLDKEAIRLVAERLSPSFCELLAGWLYDKSEGNPYILVEMVRELRRTGILLENGMVNLNALSQQDSLPETVYSMIRSRLVRLSDAARRVLDAGVAAGREFDFAVVAYAAGLSEAAALDALDELQQAGLLQLVEGGRFRFDHSLTMEVAYREVGELRHRILHLRLAEALENLQAGQRLTLSLDDAQRAALIAHHFSEGQDWLRAAPYAWEAGQGAARLAAWREAITFYQLALRGFRDSERLPVLMAMGQALARSGQFAQAVESYREALSLLDPQDFQQSVSLHYAMALALLPQSRFNEVIDLARQLCEIQRPESRMTAELLWGLTLAMQGNQLSEAEKHLKLVLSLAGDQGFERSAIAAQATFELGNIAAQRGELEQAVELYRQVLQITDLDDDATLEVRVLALNNLAYHLHLLKDPTAADIVQQGLQLAREKGVLGLLVYLYSTAGEIALAAGAVDQAEQWFSEGLALAEQYAVAERMAGLTANLGLVAAQRGQHALAIHRLSTALGQVQTLGIAHLEAQIRLWLVPLLPSAEAKEQIEAARALIERSGRQGLLLQLQELETALKRPD